MNAEILSIQNISKSFSGLKALTDVSFSINEGEIFGLIGPNGAGKTTIFNLVTGTLLPDSGSIEIFGKNTVGTKPHEICKYGVGRTFQIVKPFGDLSVLENVAIGCFNRMSSLQEAEEKAWDILKLVRLDKKALSPARSTTTPDRKRLELARAIATGPKLLLLDEVMAGLNPTEQKEIIKIILEIRQTGVTIFVISHSMRVIMSLCDRIAVINQGVCIAADTPHMIFSNQKVIEAYLGEDHDFVKSR